MENPAQLCNEQRWSQHKILDYEIYNACCDESKSMKLLKLHFLLNNGI